MQRTHFVCVLVCLKVSKPIYQRVYLLLCASCLCFNYPWLGWCRERDVFVSLLTEAERAYVIVSCQKS